MIIVLILYVIAGIIVAIVDLLRAHKKIPLHDDKYHFMDIIFMFVVAATWPVILLMYLIENYLKEKK